MPGLIWLCGHAFLKGPIEEGRPILLQAQLEVDPHAGEPPTTDSQNGVMSGSFVDAEDMGEEATIAAALGTSGVSSGGPQGSECSSMSGGGSLCLLVS